MTLRRALVLAAVWLAATSLWAQAAPTSAPKAPPSSAAPAPSGTAVNKASGAAAHPFVTIHRVLTSPRCMNCHPAGDIPLQGDDSHPHTMRVRRDIGRVGMQCMTCHRAHPVATPGAPPAAPHWQMPPQETPMVFEGLSVQALCEQLRDPARNGFRSLDDLVRHVAEDELVLWGWNPGPGRTPVPVSHADTVKAFEQWRALGGACPDDTSPWSADGTTPPSDAGPIDGGA